MTEIPEKLTELLEEIAREIALDKNLCDWTNWDTLPEVYKQDCFLPLSKRVLRKVQEHYKDCVRLAEDQSYPPELISCGFGCEDLLKDWRKIKRGGE